MDLGGHGQMGTLGLESVLIGDVGDGVGDTIIAHVGVGSLDGKGLMIGASILQHSLSLSLLAIACFPADEEERIS